MTDASKKPFRLVEEDTKFGKVVCAHLCETHEEFLKRLENVPAPSEDFKKEHKKLYEEFQKKAKP